MNIKISPSPLNGSVILPPSKSVYHRAVICAGLTNGKSVISPSVLNDDIRATINAMSSLGCGITAGDNIEITGVLEKKDFAGIDANESGSTLRFMIPVAAAVCEKTTFTGRGRLPQRPLTPYYDMFSLYEKGETELPLTVGGFKNKNFKISGGISSQFITGLLLAMPLIGDASLEITDELQSKPYVDITIGVMEKFGVTVINDNYKKFTVSGSYRPLDFTVEQDWSSAAFWLVANAIGNNVGCIGLSADSLQGDREIYKILQNCGIVFGKNFTKSGGSLSYTCINAMDIPDLVPILAVLGCFCKGGMRITNTERLRLKESDRIESTMQMITRMGGSIKYIDGELIIEEVKSLCGGCTISSFGDHRIAMAAAICATRCENPVIIEGAQCVSKSYPAFFADFIKNGGKADELDLGQ